MPFSLSRRNRQRERYFLVAELPKSLKQEAFAGHFTPYHGRMCQAGALGSQGPLRFARANAAQ